ncbi:unnamed protein product [Microthlaspi erraticum]|uniref:FBD domain-containing protein n=1 Tax=Microthlaspi erraticum TaxID=1685480 RepID=A0A6D2IIG0_9BRAS|nr:unnamed protein product [Microthlaspi erraticum]
MDRISNLTDDLLLKIVSSLPTKDVVATMLLSNRWKSIWTMLPKLDFDYGSDLEPSQYGKFIKYVDRSLVLNRAPVLETLKFKVGPYCSSEDLVTWIRIGMVRHFRELQISERTENYDSKIVLPKSLYTYAKLEVLKLAYVVVLDVPDNYCFPSLKTLHLVCVTYGTDANSLCKILSSCPVLQEFVLDKTENCFFMKSFSVDMPALRRLSIRDRCDTSVHDRDGGVPTVVINAPSLLLVNFQDCYGDLCLSGNMPKVVGANVNVSYQSAPKLLECLSSSVKRLRLSLSKTTFTHRFGFDHLLHLEICGGSPGWWDLMVWFLETSPKLQIFKIFSLSNDGTCGILPIDEWGEPRSVPECLMFHLHIFKCEYFDIRDDETNLVEYILKNARQLKTASITVEKWYSEIERSDKIDELVAIPRASSSCQLMLNGEKLVQ